MFPGYEWCNDFNPHSKWHQVCTSVNCIQTVNKIISWCSFQQAAVGLLDLIFLSDEMHLRTQVLNPDGK